MSRRCVDCGTEHHFHGSTRCHHCYRRRRLSGPVRECTRCAKQRPIHDPDGRCDLCVHLCRPRPPKLVPPCAACGEDRRLVAHGLCNRCLSKSPETTRTYAAGIRAGLDRQRPGWFDAFVAHVAERYSPSEARLRLRELSVILPAGNEPARLIEATTRPDCRLTPLGRVLDEFFDTARLRPFTGDSHARAARRREHVIQRVPEQLRAAVAAFSAAELANRERARRVHGRILTDQTLIIHLEVIAEFSRSTPSITDWATIAQTDVEAFLAQTSPAGSHILPSLRAFFGWARNQHLILTDPTRQVRNRLQRRFIGPVIDLPTQRQLFRRWTGPGVHPNEALIGLLALLHAASVNELRHLTSTDVDTTTRAITLHGRPRTVPLDPPTWDALERALDHRANLATTNPHVLVNRRNKINSQPIGPAHPNDVLEPLGVSPKLLRCTRLAQLVTTTDPLVVAELFGITNAGALYYLGDTVDDIRLPNL
jgi:integrase